jgi:hypothetical protein
LEFNLNLLQNSYDYIHSSLDLHHIADEYGMHDEQRTQLENKVKWKLAFVTMVQAFELLLKESIFRIHPNLIYEDIDTENIYDKKTISFQQAINRINNFGNCLIDTESRLFLINCSKLRNEFIHYKVNIQSEHIKRKYCKLYSLYKELHKKLLHEDFQLYTSKYKIIEGNILEFNKNLVVFRGREVYKNEMEDLKKEINENSEHRFFITKDGKEVERIKLGDESNRIREKCTDSRNLSSYTYEICDDCLAKKGELHLEGCDMEICPVCLCQAISCDCYETDETE